MWFKGLLFLALAFAVAGVVEWLRGSGQPGDDRLTRYLKRRQEQHRRIVLCVLHTYGAQTALDISRRTGYSTSHLYAMLQVMEERGLVLSDWGMPREEGGPRPRLYIAGCDVRHF